MELILNDITKTYRSGRLSVRAVDGVSLSVLPGEFVAVQGPSGCGKSTLLLVAGGLLKPDSGTVNLGDNELYSLNANERAAVRNRQIGFVFQQFHLIPYLSVTDNVMAPSIAGVGNDGMAGGNALASRADQLTQELGLTDRRRHMPGELSSGERQRTALARALFNRPAVLLADEPTGNLDSENSQIALDHMQRFVSDGGSVLMVTHDPQAVAAADRVVEIRDGRLVTS
jgi:putative ABC transport system ATP-binding protein